MTTKTEKTQTTTLKNEYDLQAEKFLNEFNIKIKKVKSNTKQSKWTPSGHHYEITLLKNDSKKSFTFDFWDSAYNKEYDKPLTDYSILSCLASDSYFIDKEEIIFNFGEELYTCKQIKEIVNHAKKINDFFTEEELEELQKIQ